MKHEQKKKVHKASTKDFRKKYCFTRFWEEAKMPGRTEAEMCQRLTTWKISKELRGTKTGNKSFKSDVHPQYSYLTTSISFLSETKLKYCNVRVYT